MNFYGDPENVKKYILMCAGYDGSNIYQALTAQLPSNSNLLELGSGAGFDIEYLEKNYNVTGSDLSDEFLRVCKEKYPEIPFLKIDALELKIDNEFDCIYSNKVLHHLTEAELGKSLERQTKILSPGGIIAHSFWLGDENQMMNNLLYTFYNENNLFEIISRSFEILSTLKYQEFEEGDSIFIIAKLKGK